MSLEPEKMTMNITYEGKPAQVQFREITAGDETEIIQKVMGKLHIVGEDARAEVDLGLYRELIVLKSLETAPFKIDLATIKTLPRSLFATLLNRASEINPFQLAGQSEVLESQDQEKATSA